MSPLTNGFSFLSEPFVSVAFSPKEKPQSHLKSYLTGYPECLDLAISQNPVPRWYSSPKSWYQAYKRQSTFTDSPGCEVCGCKLENEIWKFSERAPGPANHSGVCTGFKVEAQHEHWLSRADYHQGCFLRVEGNALTRSFI